MRGRWVRGSAIRSRTSPGWSIRPSTVPPRYSRFQQAGRSLCHRPPASAPSVPLLGLFLQQMASSSTRVEAHGPAPKPCLRTQPCIRASGFNYGALGKATRSQVASRFRHRYWSLEFDRPGHCREAWMHRSRLLPLPSATGESARKTRRLDTRPGPAHLQVK